MAGRAGPGARGASWKRQVGQPWTLPAERRRPLVVAFDVVGTLFSLEALWPRLTEAGFVEAILDEWFSRFLHAAVSLDAAGVFVIDIERLMSRAKPLIHRQSAA